MSVRLADIIEVLEAAYPPRLAQDWDSVGLVCGDPADTVETVTVAVDATAAVVAEVPDRGLLLAHHPLLLRGVDTVAASTAKGALVHQMIRAGRALFTAHTNADAASPGVSDALADALGLDGRGGAGADLRRDRLSTSGWSSCRPRTPTRYGRRCSRRARGHIGDYSHCSWSVPGTGQFLPHEGAAPTIGSVGTVERVPEERVEVIAPTRLRGHVLAALRAAHPYEEPAFDIFALAPVPGDVGLGRIGVLPRPETLSAFVSRVHDALPGTSWGVRASGEPDARRFAGRGVRRSGGFAARRRRGRRMFRPTSPRTFGTIPPMNTGARRMWRWSTSRIGPVSSRGVHRRRSCCVAISVSRCRVRVSAVRTDPWNVERNGT